MPFGIYVQAQKPHSTSKITFWYKMAKIREISYPYYFAKKIYNYCIGTNGSYFLMFLSKTKLKIRWKMSKMYQTLIETFKYILQFS